MSVDLQAQAFGSNPQEQVLREAVARLLGAPTPEMDAMQAALSREAEVRAAHAILVELLGDRVATPTAKPVAKSKVRATRAA